MTLVATLGGCADGRQEVRFGSGTLHAFGREDATVLDFASGQLVPAPSELRQPIELGELPEDAGPDEFGEALLEQQQRLVAGVAEKGDLAYFSTWLIAASRRIAKLGTGPLAPRSGEDLSQRLASSDVHPRDANRPGLALLVETRDGGHAVVRIDAVDWQKSLRIRWAYRARGPALFPDLAPLDALDSVDPADLDARLVWAVRELQAEEVRTLLAAGASPEARMSGGRPLLTTRLTLEIAQLLLEAGADVNAATPEGETSLHAAVLSGDPERLERMLAAGADPARRTSTGKTALDLAAAHEGPEREALVARLRAARAAEGSSALFVAARLGELDRVEALLADGLPVDALDPDRRTALQLAAVAGHVEVVRVLLSAGADPAAETLGGPGDDRMTPLVAAVMARQVAAVDALLEASDRVPDPVRAEALRTAIRADDAELAARLLDAGFDPEKKADERWTPILLVRRAPKPAIVDLFAERGYEMTLWTWARLGREEQLDRALAAGAQIDEAPSSGDRPPLLQAVSLNDVRATKLLLERGASPDVAESWSGKRAALHLAAASAPVEATVLLLEAGAFPDPLDARGRTPLYLAVPRGNLDVVRHLLEAGADPALHPEGRPPMQEIAPDPALKELLREAR